MSIPLGDPKEKEYRKEVLAKDKGILGYDWVFADMERAARFESCDWELSDPRRQLCHDASDRITTVSLVCAIAVGE